TDGSTGEPNSVGRASWAEWLYFNARSADGRLRFYLTFMTGAPDTTGQRPAYVRLQLNRDGQTTNFPPARRIPHRAPLPRAPDPDIAGNRVRLLSDGRYQITLALEPEPSKESRQSAFRPSAFRIPHSALAGSLSLAPAAGRSIP